VELHDYVAPEMLGAHLRSADVHLVSLDAEWTGTMVPSKLQGVFAAERPVVFIGSADSSIGRWVRESGGGWVVEPGDVAALAEAIEEAGDPQERARRGRAAKLFADLNFDRKTNVARVAEVLGGSAKG
jgi:glycosyltransferase involved in cell wall biosynthesis